MEIFEFHFNPKGKSDLIFDSFCYEPENIYEKRLGSLYMMGTLKNILPQNAHFLETLARTIKEKYYKTASATPETSLREALKKANENLEKIAREGDVSWLGNLNFAIAAFKNFELNFTKVGELKVYLLRKGHVIDIDQKLKFQDIEPYPLKIFGNIVSGKLTENDTILILTKEISDFFQNQKLITQIASISPFGQKKLREVLNGKKEELSKIPGMCLLVVLTKETYPKEKEILTPKRTFKLKQVFVPLFKVFKTFKLPKIPQVKPGLAKLKPKISITKFPKFKFPSLLGNKKINLILLLIFFLALGFFIFEKTEEKELGQYSNQVNQIQEKINQAESYLIVAETNPQARKNANLLLKESWDQLSPLIKLSSTFPPELANKVTGLESKISENLYELNRLVKIEKPELVFEFKPREYVPQKLVYFKESLYLFTPYSENVFELNRNKEGSIITINKKIDLADSLADAVLFFEKPDQLLIYQDNNFKEPFPLKTPYPEFNFNDLSSFQSNLYFLDRSNGKIIKYPYLGNFQWGQPQLWLSNKKAKDFKSLAVDGSVWVLTKDNSIERYYAGTRRKTLELNIFPTPKYFSKIFTSSSLPYLYLLEPGQKKIIILNKSGQILKQYQSEEFDNLLDFSVSDNGKAIYLLNGLKVYKVELF